MRDANIQNLELVKQQSINKRIPQTHRFAVIFIPIYYIAPSALRFIASLIKGRLVGL